MKDKDYIKELFSEKLSSHEVPVRSDLWSGIQSQIGNTAATTTVAAKGISVAAKWAIGIASSVIVAGSVVWFASDGETPQKTKEVQLSNVEQEAQISEVPMEEANIKASENQLAETQLSGQSVGQRYSHMDEELRDANVGTMDNPPLIVLPAEVKYVESKVSEIENKATPAGSQESKTSKANDEQTNQVAEQPKVVGEITAWRKTNVFSPNGDGRHDYFFLETKNLKEFQITIYNNETKKTVFSSTDPDFKWFGENAPDGSYGYVVIAVDENGNRIATANELMIVR